MFCARFGMGRIYFFNLIFMTKQISISLCANEGRVADALRALANYIEECDEDAGYPAQYESDICCAEITND